jgi:hypothetical protein
MPAGSFLGVLVCVLPCLALAAVPAPSIPDTPAGRALDAWLDAFNSGDRAKFESFEKAHAPWLTLVAEMGLRARTGGYDLLSIDKSDKLWIVFRTRERASSTEIIGRLVVRSYEPDHITLLSLASPGANLTEVTLDEAERTRVIDGAAKLLDEFYLFPDVSKRVAAKLRTQQQHRQYRDITDGEIFAIRLTDDLVALSGDKHVAVDFFIRVPFGRFVNPVTKTDWEGTGVEPDVNVSATEALDVAEKLAAEEISKSRLHPGIYGSAD